jgi:hypothetical protein
VVAGSVREIIPSAKDKEIEGYIKEWLKHASKRTKQKNNYM